MKDLQEILTEKESELHRIQKEVDSLRAVIPLLDGEHEPEAVRKPVSSTQVTETHEAFPPDADSKAKFWNLSKRWRQG